ncbi:unnamed protein product [Amoebophrya sp. A25]|nr:unnamed protein product [Amoebophrya sp. A25]|eukprot:GSA25T00027548001.1
MCMAACRRRLSVRLKKRALAAITGACTRCSSLCTNVLHRRRSTTRGLKIIPRSFKSERVSARCHRRESAKRLSSRWCICLGSIVASHSNPMR